MRLRLQDKKVILILLSFPVLIAIFVNAWYLVIPLLLLVWGLDALVDYWKRKESTQQLLIGHPSEAEKKVLQRLSERLARYEGMKEVGRYVSCVYQGKNLGEVEQELSFLRKNLKDVGGYEKGQYYCCIPKNPSPDIRMNQIAHYSDYFNERCERIFKTLLNRGVAEAQKDIVLLSDYLLRELQVEVRQEYIALKIREAELRYKQAKFRQEALERAKDEKDARKEYRRVLAETEKQIEEAEDQIWALEEKWNGASSKEEAARHLAKINELERLIDELKKKQHRAQSMAQQTRAGFVYIISNEESFGKGIFKIGMTRRPDPMIRVNELGDASVPFPFKVHLFIYSEDAPTLETQLHRYFADHRVNTANYMKEFFRVRLSDILKALEEMGIPVERTPELEEDLAAERPQRPPINIGAGVRILG